MSQGHCSKDSYYNNEFGTCSCEEHCNWDSCRLTDPPTDCLNGLNSEWKWDYIERAWVAQVIQGINS